MHKTIFIYLLLSGLLYIPIYAQDIKEGDALIFFPEGGALLPDEPCKVACKVLTEDSVSGFIANENKDSIAPLLFHTTKYALVQFTPKKGMRYYAYYRKNDRQWMYTELPPVEENAYALSVNQTPNKLIVAVHGKSNHPQAPYRITLRSGKHIYYQEAWSPQSTNLVFDKSQFLSGILRIELTDKQGEIISERPVFLLNKNQIAISNTVNKQKEHLELILKLAFKDQPLTGSYSIYVTEDTEKHSSNQLFALYPSDDMQQNLEYISSAFLDKIQQNIRLCDLYMLCKAAPQDMQTIHLEEVSIQGTASQKEEPANVYEQFADYTLSQKQIERTMPTHIFDLIRRLPGVYINNKRVLLHRTNKPVGLVIDGIIIETGNEYNSGGFSSYYDNIEPAEVEEISIIKGGRRSILGPTAFNGLIYIKTKKGKRVKKNIARQTEEIIQRTEYADTSKEKILYTHPLQPLSPQGELSIRMPIKQLHSETLTVSIHGNTEEEIMIQGIVQINLPHGDDMEDNMNHSSF